MKQSKLLYFNLHNKRVFLRADLNIPFVQGSITNDFRLRALQPTLNFIHKQNAIIFLATHLGRPNGSVDQNLSTQILIPWFEKNGYEILFEPNIFSVINTDYKPGSIILLENLRFFKGEQTHDKSFAQELASCAEYYVNDAFGTLHRNDTSITLLPQLFDDTHKTIGFLIEKELANLSCIKNNPQQPFALIIGGGKVETKLALIEGLLDSVSDILLCPAMVFTFLKAMGKRYGSSLIDPHSLDKARTIMFKAEQKNVILHFPNDYQITYDVHSDIFSYCDAEDFPNNAFGVSIGPKTCEQWNAIISRSKTIFMNAAMGFSHLPATLQGAASILSSIAASNSFSVVGGGDSIALVEKFKLTNAIDFLSTGGGSTLAYLSGQTLPGLKYI